VELETLAFLIASPVHEEAVRKVHQEDGDDHVHPDAEGGYAGQQSKQQADAAEKLGKDCQRGERRGDLHPVSEHLHRAGEACPAPPPEDLLRAVSEKGDAEGEAE